MKLSQDQSRKVQFLRGLAIIAVVFIHNTPVGLTQVFFRPFVNFCVGLFLFLSGMLSSANSWKPRKRLQKVLIPYLIWTLIYVILNQRKTPANIPVAFVKGLISGNAASIMYYIFIYCEFTILTPLIERLANSKWKYAGFLFSPIEILFTRMLPMIVGFTLPKYVQMVLDLTCFGWFTYFYLGYLLGNNKIQIKTDWRKLLFFWGVSILIQMLEGYLYWTCLGITNCGSQLKLSTVLSGVLFALLAYHYILSEKNCRSKALQLLGDSSFGIYFSHLAVMFLLKQIPYYTTYVVFPINAIVALLVSLGLVLLGKKLLGKLSYLLAF